MINNRGCRKSVNNNTVESLRLNLNSLLNEKGKLFYTIECSDKFTCDVVGIRKISFDQVGYDVMTKRDFKLALQQEYEKSGLSSVQDTIRGCSESGVAMLGNDTIVFWTNNPDSLLASMEMELCIDLINAHMQRHGSYSNLTDEEYELISERTLESDLEAVRHFNEYVHNKEVSECLERLMKRNGDATANNVSDGYRLTA